MHSMTGERLRPSPLPLTFIWAVAEATVWPVMPDAVLVPLAAARPYSWWWLTLAAVAGTVLGGAISYVTGRTVSPRLLLAHLPLIRPAMVEAADRWLADEGPLGVRHQALSGVPFKVFALSAGAREVPLVPFLACAAAVRGPRFLVAAGGAGLLGRQFHREVRRYPLPLLAAWTLVFGLGFWKIVVAWERRTG